MKFIFTFLFMLLCFSACETEDDSSENLVVCEILCENGYLVDENGLEICECIIYGCMDPDAANYNPLANIDDETCLYPLFSENVDNNK